MPRFLDVTTRQKLLVVKQLYQHALVQASRKTLTAKLFAVIGFDLAVESLLSTVIVSLDSSKSSADNFPGLLQQCEQVLRKEGIGELPDRAHLLQTHAVRNDAQHRARYPNDTEVEDSRTYTRSFLNKLVELMWAVEFETLSLTDLVQHERARTFLNEAEAALQAKDLQTSAFKASAAIHLSLLMVERAIVGQFPRWSTIMMVDSSGKLDKGDSRDAQRSLERMQDILVYLTLGLSYPDFVRFRQIAGEVAFTSDMAAHSYGRKENLSESEAEFVLSFATESVFSIESAVGNLEQPFGSDRW